jgi:Fungal N-terminal domain of STAND proteins
LIAATKSDLEDRLDIIDARLQSLPPQTKQSPKEATYRQEIQDGRDNTTWCLGILTQVSMNIDQVRHSVWKGVSRPGQDSQHPVKTVDTLFSPCLTTDETLTKCNTMLKTTSGHLQNHLSNINTKLTSMPSQPEMSEQQAIERQKTEEENESIKQSLAFCEETSELASSKGRSIYEDINFAEDNNNIIVSIIGDLLSVRRLTTGPRTSNLMGQVSDDSVQLFTKTLPNASRIEATDTQPGAARRFETRYGAGNVVSQGGS